MAIIPLGNKNIGDIAKINVMGTLRDFIVVHKGRPSSIYGPNYDDGVILLMKDVFEKHQYKIGGDTITNSYSESTIHEYLNSTFLNLIDEKVRAQIKQVQVPWRSKTSTNMSYVPAYVWLLGNYELNWTETTQANIKEDGATLSYFAGAAATSAKRIAYLDGAPTSYWTRSGRHNGNTTASYVTTSGGQSYGEVAGSQGIRPALVLPSSIMVADDGTIVTNSPPAISGTDADLGVQTGPFTQGYTVTDPDTSDIITVAETLNGQQVRQYVAANGEAQTFSVTEDIFRPLLNGSSVMEIEAFDQMGAVAKRLFTFTRAETRIEVSLAGPLPADAQPKRILASVSRQIPAGATFQVLACNNAYDAAPTWENITESVITGKIFGFQNETKTAETWGVNIKAIVERNGATGPCWIATVGGNFD